VKIGFIASFTQDAKVVIGTVRPNGFAIVFMPAWL